MKHQRNIYWLDLNCFDQKKNKSPWLEIGEVLIEHGFRVHLLCGFKKERTFPEKYRIDIVYLRSSNRKGLFKLTLLLSSFFWLMRHAKTEDVLFIRPDSLLLAYCLRLFRGCRAHLDIRSVPVEIHSILHRLDYLLYWFLPLKFLRNVPQSYSFITPPLKKAVEAEFKTRFDNYVIWSSGVNTRHFKPALDNYSLPEERLLVTYVGVVTKNRGIDSVIESLALLEPDNCQKVRFRIIGDGPFLESLKTLCTGLQLEKQVEFQGHVPYEQVPEKVADTDCFICPLPDRPEWNISSPIKVFEYLACAKPVILTPISAHQSILEGQDFVVWTKGYEPQDFADAIRYAFLNHQQLLKAAGKARSFVKKNYDWHIQGQKLANYLTRHYARVE